MPDVVKSLAGDNATNPNVAKAIADAKKEAVQGNGDFVDLFVKNYQQLAGMNQLGGIFAARLGESNITPSSTDEQVKAVLNEQVKAAVGNSFEVLRTRIDQFGVVQPNIQTLEAKASWVRLW